MSVKTFKECPYLCQLIKITSHYTDVYKRQAYTYSYATMGELIAWIIGWDLVLEYTVAATTVSISWSRYLVVFLEGVGINIPHALAACPWDGGIVNIPAALIVVLMSIFLIRGTEGSSIFNGFIVFLKVAVILIFVVLGWKYINAANYVPYIPVSYTHLPIGTSPDAPYAMQWRNI